MAKYLILGGAGAMGRITARDLFETCSANDELILADYDLGKADILAEQFAKLPRARSKQAPRVSTVEVDVRSQASLSQALSQAFVVINCAPYVFNIEVMHACLNAKAHYVDLGGLFHTTRKQLELDSQFQAVGKTALVGMGAAPGITNILSKYAADQLDTVQEIHTRVASVDQTKYVPEPVLAVSYTLQTILEEFSFPPAVFTKGEFKFVEPMTGDIPMDFPKPVGTQKPMYTIHSEVATLPLSFKSKGVKEVSFKIAFDPEFTDRVRFLRDLGFTPNKEIEVKGTKIRPIDVVTHLAMNQKPVKISGKLKQYEIVRAIVKGAIKRKKFTYIVDCHTTGMPEWDVGLDIDTGSPPAIGAQMLSLGQIQKTGVIPAEVAIDPEIFFKHLKKRNMFVKVVKKSGWGLKT